MSNKTKPLLFSTLAAALLLTLLFVTAGTAAPPPHLSYGFNVAEWDVALVQSMEFDWIKLFDPPGSRLPVNVLLRIDANAAHLDNLSAFANGVTALATASGAYIEAYEVGNEVNLDASYGWAAPPDAAAYVTLLCTAYERIKAADPASLVISAGLAPTGRVSGTWNGHNGHNGQYQDEREYLREFVAAGGGNCADAIGYHPYGFSADFDAPPDVPSGDPTLNCANGFCFRGAESFYAVMQQEGLGEHMVWATEFGWIVFPPPECLSDPGFQGREWQLVTEAKQASNLVGAFAYADANWPWMGGMFVFNLNFNVAPWYPLCEQMRYYAVQDRPAEDALRDMPKNPAPTAGLLQVQPAGFGQMQPVAAQPLTLTLSLNLLNSGYEPITYTATAVTGTDLLPLLPDPTGSVAPGQSLAVPVLISSAGRASGIYDGAVRIETVPATATTPITVPVTLYLVDTLYETWLPATLR